MNCSVHNKNRFSSTYFMFVLFDLFLVPMDKMLWETKLCNSLNNFSLAIMVFTSHSNYSYNWRFYILVNSPEKQDQYYIAPLVYCSGEWYQIRKCNFRVETSLAITFKWFIRNVKWHFFPANFLVFCFSKIVGETFSTSNPNFSLHCTTIFKSNNKFYVALKF